MKNLIFNERCKYKDELFNIAKNTLPDVPDSWLVVPSGELFSYVTSGSRGWSKYYSEDGALFIRMNNLKYISTRLFLNDLQYVNLPKSVEGKRSLVAIDDLLISITADVGRVARVNENLGEAYINQHVALARPNISGYSEYLAITIAAENIGRNQIEELKRGVTKAGLGLDDIKSLAIPLPSIVEAQEIVRRVEALFALADSVEKQYLQAFSRLKPLLQSILAKGFRGELAPQDPNDEPAEKLLARIQAEREKLIPAKKPRKTKKSS